MPFALAWETPAAWAEHAARDPLALLSDHAHCELGAAASAQGMIARRPSDAPLVDRLAALALEELRHFRQVHRLLRELGGVLLPVRPNEYVGGLLRAARGSRPTAPEPPVPGHAVEAMLDRLLVAALIERRSLERFELLAAAAPAPLADLYAELGPSEAGHATVFLDFARERWPRAVVGARFDDLREREGALIRALPFAPIMHSGPPAREVGA